MFTLPFGQAHVFYPEASEDRWTAANHRFEWTRRKLEDWAGEVAGRFGYGVRFLPIGPEDPELGAPTQMAVFER